MLCTATLRKCEYQTAGAARAAASCSGVVSIRLKAAQLVSALTTGGAGVQALDKLVKSEAATASLNARPFLGRIVQVLH